VREVTLREIIKWVEEYYPDSTKDIYRGMRNRELKEKLHQLERKIEKRIKVWEKSLGGVYKQNGLKELREILGEEETKNTGGNINSNKIKKETKMDNETLLIDLGVDRNPERFRYDKIISSIEVKRRTGTAYLSFSKDGYKFNLDFYEELSCPSKEFFIYNKKQNGLLELKLTFGTSLRERIKELLSLLILKRGKMNTEEIRKALVDIIGKYTDIHLCLDYDALDSYSISDILSTLSDLLDHMDKELRDFAERSGY